MKTSTHPPALRPAALHSLILFLLGCLLGILAPTRASASDAPATPTTPTETVVAEMSGNGQIRTMSLEECLTEAMTHSRRRPASQYAVAMAEAQHRQAMAGYWPQVGLKGAYQRMDEAPNFLFPATQMQVPAGSDHLALRSQLNLLVGTEVLKKLNGE